MVLNSSVLSYAQQELMQRPEGDGVVRAGWIVEGRVRDAVLLYSIVTVAKLAGQDEQKKSNNYVIYSVRCYPNRSRHTQINDRLLPESQRCWCIDVHQRSSSRPLCFNIYLWSSYAAIDAIICAE